MTAINAEGKGAGLLSFELTGTTSTTGGAIASVLNPEGVALYITRSYMLVKTASTGAANIDIGTGSTATTDGTDIINALAINGVSANTLYNGSAQVVTAKTAATAVTWAATGYINATGSASSAGFTGTCYIEYVRA